MNTIENDISRIKYINDSDEIDISPQDNKSAEDIFPTQGTRPQNVSNGDETVYQRAIQSMLTSVYGNNGDTATPEEQKALEDLARMYPRMFAAIPMMQWDLFKTLAVKNSNYGVGNITMGGDVYNDPKAMQFALTALSIRLNDKMQRFMNLVRKEEVGTADETIMDTLLDMSNYALIGAVLLTNNWGK